MPTFEVLVRGQRRSFLLTAPADWTAYPWGSLTLVLGLHGDGQTAEEFYAASDIDGLMAGRYDPGPMGPMAQKLVAVFPAALSLSRSVAGSWNTGFSASDGGLMSVPDVEAWHFFLSHA